MNPVAERLGEIGMPEPMASLAARDWDAVVIGAGHNGLTAAAYLARAGQKVLVLESRERVGGACTLERPFAEPGYVSSPCAYVVGLLDNLVIDELDLKRRGLRFFTADPNLWVPFEDGSSFSQFLDRERTVASLDALGVSAADQRGYWQYERLFDEVRIRLRKGERDTWVGDSPSRDEIEEMLGGDQEMIDLCFSDSIADVLTRYIGDQRLQDALYGQGVIGTWGGPYEPGTASVKLMHYQGDLEGQGPVWGYVEGGMGMVSFAIADAAIEAGASVACGVEVARIEPDRGVVCEDGTVIRARTIVCNTDPKRLLGFLGGESIDPGFSDRLEAWKIRSPVVKFNAALERLPDWTAAPANTGPARATIDVCGSMDEAQGAFERCAEGEPTVAYAEIYTQTGFDPSVAPEGKHLMSAFGQYAPYDIEGSHWDARRGDVARQFIDLIGRFAPDFGDCVIEYEVLGPPDIESRVGLTGGNIFQGEITPDQMWQGRLGARTPLPGLYMSGAATHPAGSVIALNGRNAAQAVLADSGGAINSGRS